MNMKNIKDIKTEIFINAKPDTVWRILTDFESYSKWNPFIQEISGELGINETLSVFLKPPNAKGITMKPKILRLEENRELRWIGHLLFPGLFDGEHSFEIVGQDKGCLFIQSEKFKGILSGMIVKRIREDTQNAFETMNRAFKDLAESRR